MECALFNGPNSWYWSFLATSLRIHCCEALRVTSSLVISSCYISEYIGKIIEQDHSLLLFCLLRPLRVRRPRQGRQVANHVASFHGMSCDS